MFQMTLIVLSVIKSLHAMSYEIKNDDLWHIMEEQSLQFRDNKPIRKA
jgi:hypothetical protein